MRKSICILISIIMLFIGYNEVLAYEDITDNNNNLSLSSEISKYSFYDYVINKYDINIVVNENNTFNITESITVYFNTSKHGIYRKIPLKNKVTRLDGTTSNNRAQISDISVNEKYSLYNEDGYKVIKIGDANYTINGQKEYIISYLYNLGKDTGKNYDELYFNLIGDEWDTIIGNVTFTITMPKEFDSSKLGFSSGASGSTDASKVAYSVDGNVITGNLNGMLNPQEALTVRLELPEGYFVGASFTTNPLIYVMFIIPILGLIITMILWYKFGRDDQVVETVEFYPPEGFNSLEVGFLYKGEADDKDVTSLLIYLANKGYIKITETEDKSLFFKVKEFKITKLKEYDGNNINEQIFLKGLFSKKNSVGLSKVQEIIEHAKQNGEKISYANAYELASIMPEESSIDTVTSTDLYNNFYITMDKILSNINQKENKNKIFEKSVLGKLIIIILLMIISIITTITIPTLEYAEVEELKTTLFLCALYVPNIAICIFGKVPLKFRVFCLVFIFVHSFIFFRTLPITEAITTDFMYFLGFIIGILCLIGMIVFCKLIPKRTPYGNEMLGKLRGFKNFLETAEKDKLEAMVMQDPNYFYDILPFTYVLGISDKWIKKFESISLQAPSWYDSCSGFNVTSFGSFMSKTMTSAQTSMSSSPSSDSDGSSGGGSSGGGSSGGGSGGGGGGSW